LQKPHATLPNLVATNSTLDHAFAWLCRRRRDWPDAADVWELRRRWPEEKERLRAELRAGTFRFGLLERIEKEDALVLKALALVLEGVLPVSRRCTHIKGHGGAKAAVGRAAVRLRRLPFVIRTDVRGYYANIDPVKLVERLARYVPDPEILRLVTAVTARTSERGGLFRDSGGLPLGCPLSPLLGAFFLHELDARLEATGLFYVRYMDDILVLAPTRWKLRRAVRIVKETLAALGLTKHPDKTFIGPAAKGFDFLGYRLSPKGLTVAKQTLDRFAERAARLQEQERTGRVSPGALGAYVRRWLRWLGACVRAELPQDSVWFLTARATPPPAPG
jgi:hypothetical protein